MLTLPPDWEGVATTLEQLRANYSELGEFLDRQWEELEEVRGEMAEQARVLEYRGRALDRKEEDLTARLELAEVYKQLAQTRCDLVREFNGEPEEVQETLLAAWMRIEELEKEIIALKRGKEAMRSRDVKKTHAR